MFVRVLCLVGVVLGLGCGGSHHTPGMTAVSANADAGESSGSATCVDEDGDRFGKGCVAGPDCDDSDPMVTDECTRCVMPAIDCPCESGTKPTKCDPHYSMKTMGGTLVCSEGTRYCRDGYYSDCEVLLQYVMFVAD